MSTEASPDMPVSEVKVVLTQGRKDLWNAQLPGFLGTLYDPIRDFILDPSFAIASIILPPITTAVPHADPVAAKLISGLVLFPMRSLHSLIGASTADQQQQQDAVDLRREARNDILVNAKAGLKVPHFRPPSDLASAIRGAIAFGCSVTADLVGAVMDRKKMKKWFQALTEFKAYLDVSGVGDELEEAMMKPLLRGRLLDNVKILNDIQEKLFADRGEKLKNDATEEEIQAAVVEGHRMMRFATAAYGTEMIRSALDRDARPQELENQKKAIAFHSDVSEDDIRILCVDDGGCMKVLRHFVAIDRKSKSVVLALRGTLSISGTLIDMQAMDAEFCCGKAHKGIAEMADNVWAESGDKILQLFEDEEELRDFAFVITGHSLGAGTACLLNVKCHVDKLLGNRTVKCYGFAPPPTYVPDGSAKDPMVKTAIQSAMDNCLCYIHDNDCVPLLSVLSIRRLALLMDTVDNKTEHIWAYRRFRIFWEWDGIPEDIFDAVCLAETDSHDRETVCVDGASRLLIPARLVVWMKKNFAGSFEAIGCDPGAVTDMNIFCCEDMISDHMPEQYEDALDALAGQGEG